MRDSDEERCPVLFRCRHHLWGDLTKFCWSFKSIYSSVSRSTDLFLHLSFLALPPILFIRLTSTSNLLNTCCLLLLLAFPSTIFSTLYFLYSTSFVSLSLLHFLFLCPFVFEFHAAFTQPTARPRFPSQCLSTLNPPQSPLYPVLSLILLLPLIPTLIPLSSSFFPSTSFPIPLWLSRWSANVPPNMGEPRDLKNGFSKRLWGWSITAIKANKGDHWMMHTPPITHKYSLLKL